ncbi:MAG: LacI family DNA-binding transcriptional regulator, partial [Spirochaetota bacterium]
MKKHQDKRIGLILASIHTGSSLNLWTALAGEAARAGVSFFIFPGGRLDSLPDSEFLRNSIYRLANVENLDSLISWGSSIGGAVAIRELEKFHRALDPLPYVTIAHKMDGHPSVKFDAYAGMKSLMLHFLEVHRARKIAFIRGPSNHLSAEDRFRAYKDALTESGIGDEGLSQLVSDPFPWSDGEAAVIQLCESRGLVPGRDFDTLVGASDMMILAAVQYLEDRGYTVPGDFRCGGFNDSAESRILSSPLSTVHMPYAELGLSAFRLVLALGGSEGTRVDQDTVLSTDLVIRESCGCGKGSWPLATLAPRLREDAGRRRESLFRELSDLFRLDETDQNAFLQPLFSILEEGKAPGFLNLFEKVLFRYFDSDREPRLLFKAMGMVNDSGCFDPETISALVIPMLQTVSQVQDRVMALEKYETGKRYLVLNSLKCDLLCTRDRRTLIQILCRHLPVIGIHSAALVIYVDEEYSRFLGGFLRSNELPEDCEPFPSRHLLPASLATGFRNDVFLIQPLFMENQSLGYVICNVPLHIGAVFEELRSSLSSAIRGIFLFEETLAAQKRAEEAERAQTEFFANVGNELSDPLEELSGQLAELEALVSASPGNIPELAKRVGGLRAKLSSQIERTNQLLDLTLSQTNELPFNRHLFRPRELFPDEPEAGSACLPLLFGDPARFRQSLQMLRTFY